MSLCFKQGSERRATPSYTLEDAFELVPGNWVFEIWQGNRKLATQSFRIEGETFRVESVSNECDHCEGF
jgi:hypothetical protein